VAALASLVYCLRVPTIEGDIYFKAVSPVNPYEPELLGALARWRPDRVPRLLAVEAERGWVLMRDAGTPTLFV
jgi:hypothetical protein